MRFLLALVVLLLSSAAVTAFAEDFEDDTVGARPVGDYTFYGPVGPVVANSTGVAYEGVQYLSGSDGAGEFGGGGVPDICGTGAVFSWWAKLEYSSTTQRTYLQSWQIQQGGGTNTATHSSKSPFGISASAENSTHFKVETFHLDTGNNRNVVGRAFGYEFGQWYKYEVFNATCSSSGGSFQFRVYDTLGSYEGATHNLGSLDLGPRTVVGIGRGSTVVGPDSLYWSLDDAGDAPPSEFFPLAPAGLSAFVQKTVGVQQDGEIVLRWPLSASDPDQEAGNLTYSIYVDGVDVGDDLLNARDGGGYREALVVLGGAPTSFVFQVTATNNLGYESAKSCAVVVDGGLILDSDSCGDASGLLPGGGGVPVGDGGLLDLEPLAGGLGLPIASVGWIVGVALIAGLAVGGFFLGGFAGAAGGAALGLAGGVGLGWVPIWVPILMVMVIVGAFLFTKGRD